MAQRQTEQGPVPAAGKVRAGPFPYQIEPPSAVARRRLLLFTLLGAIAYSLALIGTMPARLLLDRANEPARFLAVSGTIWNGEAALSHGHAMRWSFAPLASIANLAFTTDLRVTGPDTELEGEVSWRPAGIVARNLRGTASASLISALVPSLPFVCDFPMSVDLQRVAFGTSAPGAAGEVRGSGGYCTPRGTVTAAATPVPPLIAEAATNIGGSTGWVAPRANRTQKLISFAVTPGGATSVEVDPAASAILPGIEAVRALAD